MLLSKATEEYLRYRRTEGYAVNTVFADKACLRRLLRAVGDIPVKSITPKHIDRLFEQMADQGLRSSTINGTVATLRTFTRWCRDRGYLPPDANPASGRRYRPKEAREMTRVPIAQFPALLDSARHPRDRMLLALGLYTMGRKTEITGIQMQHVDLDSSEVLMYIKKKNIYDRIPISKELRRELSRWLPIYEEHVGPLQPNYYLVPSTQGGGKPTVMKLRPRMQMVTPEDAVTYTLAQIGIVGDHTGMHVLRRSAARARFDEMVALGYDGALRRVSAWLHHSSVTITEGYLGLQLDRAQRDEETKDKLMFPSLEADNIVAFRSKESGESNEPGHAAM